MAVEAACHEVIRSGDGKESIMKAQVGDELVVKGRHVGDQDRIGVIIEVRGKVGGPPYLGAVERWPCPGPSVHLP